MNLANKNILFLCPEFFGYEIKIAKKMKDLGANVEYFDARSVTSAFEKALNKVNPSLFTKKTNDYYDDILMQVKDISFDYVLVIRGEMTPVSFLKKIKELSPQAKLILYLWDSIKNVVGIDKKIYIYDSILSFDPLDSRKYQNVIFRPLFFSDDYQKQNSQSDYKYDIIFLGTIHSDRFKIIKEIEKQCQESNLKTYWFKFLQGRFIYHFYKLIRSEFRNTKITDFDFDKMHSTEIAKIVDATKVVLDIEHPHQTGLTMRTIEMIGMEKKIITTNSSIQDYDFYNPNNILIIDRKNPVLDMSFFEKKYEEISEELYFKYSLEGWLLQVFSFIEVK
ncbi:capsular biosynthesis protein CpsH [Streptococcus sp. 20-1249]|uniref:capsular biosynthesis protein CpsH n=1 Tax=Streptococcus hepaticus TaxID=3349163 RepID=UPI0037494CDD